MSGGSSALHSALPADPSLDLDSVVSPECDRIVVVHSNPATSARAGQAASAYYQQQFSSAAVQIKSELHVCNELSVFCEDDHDASLLISSLLISSLFQISHGHLEPLISDQLVLITAFLQSRFYRV